MTDRGIENAAPASQRGSGERQTGNSTHTYHRGRRAATTAVTEGAPAREPSFTAPRESVSMGASPLSVSHTTEARATLRDLVEASDLRLAIRIECGSVQAECVERRALEAARQRLMAENLREQAQAIEAAKKAVPGCYAAYVARLVELDAEYADLVAAVGGADQEVPR